MSIPNPHNYKYYIVSYKLYPQPPSSPNSNPPQLQDSICPSTVFTFPKCLGGSAPHAHNNVALIMRTKIRVRTVHSHTDF